MTTTLYLLRQILRYDLRSIVGVATSILDLFYPKDNLTIVFGSNETNRVSGDPKAMFEDIRESYPDYPARFITKSPSEEGHIQSNMLQALLISLGARFCVTSHGLQDFGYFK